MECLLKNSPHCSGIVSKACIIRSAKKGITPGCPLCLQLKSLVDNGTLRSCKYEKLTTEEVLEKLSKFSNRSELYKESVSFFKFCRRSEHPEIKAKFESILKRKSYQSAYTEAELENLTASLKFGEIYKKLPRNLWDHICLKNIRKLADISPARERHRNQIALVEKERLFEDAFLSGKVALLKVMKESKGSFDGLNAIYSSHRSLSSKLHVKVYQRKALNKILDYYSIETDFLQVSEPIPTLNEIVKSHPNLEHKLLEKFNQIGLITSKADMEWRLNFVKNTKNIQKLAEFYYLEIKFHNLQPLVNELLEVRDLEALKLKTQGLSKEEFISRYPKEYKFMKYVGYEYLLCERNSVEKRQSYYTEQYKTLIPNFSSILEFRQAHPGLFNAIRRVGIYDEFSQQFKENKKQSA